jgi:hypothetical protein
MRQRMGSVRRGEEGMVDVMTGRDSRVGSGFKARGIGMFDFGITSEKTNKPKDIGNNH